MKKDKLCFEDWLNIYIDDLIAEYFEIDVYRNFDLDSFFKIKYKIWLRE